MAAAHLRLEARRPRRPAELAALLRDDELKGQVQQQVAQLVADGAGLAFAQRVVELEHLLDQVGPQRLAGLRPVPGAAGPEVAHHRQGASKR